MEFVHISKVPYNQRQELTRWESGENRDGFELTQGKHFLAFKYMNVYGGCYQGGYDILYQATSERKAKAIFNQMAALKTYKRASAYFEYAIQMGWVKAIPLYMK